MRNRDLQAARDYHESTKHTAQRIRSTPQGLDWSIQPIPFKIYTGLDPIPLPAELPAIEVPTLAAITSVGANREHECVPDLVTLTQLLQYSAGVTKRKRYPGGEILFRAAACTGALYHIDLYVVCGDLPGLAAGVYHFGPHDRALRRLRSGDYRGLLVSATAAEPTVAAAPAVMICTSTFWRNSWKYRARAYRHCFWDCGTLLANLLAVATARAVPSRVVLGFVDDAVNALLDLDTHREVALALVPIGHTSRRVDPAMPNTASLALETEPLSAREIEYPEIHSMHAASSLESPEEVADWRGASPEASQPAPTGLVFPLQPFDESAQAQEAIDRTIFRRASARTFARERLDFRLFSTMLHTATQGIPADYLAPLGSTLTHLYLIVNAVDGLPPGAYLFRRRRRALELLREGGMRREAGYLGLGQQLPADASADIFALADLEKILAGYGNRGYRAAQLEAAIIAGKLYLAAYAQHAGATGLTFFDDDVTTFFSPHGAGKSVLFLTALGLPARRRGRG